jgi:hypothetical protein
LFFIYLLFLNNIKIFLLFFRFISMSNTSTSEFFCSTCQKKYKKQSGLSRHLNTVKKYNILREDLDNLPEINNNRFKSILVYLIHRKLSIGFKKGGHQLVSLACTEHQFFNTFKGHIHYHNNRNVYRCIFRGSVGYQMLSEILNNSLWGRKFYEEEQQTYVVLFDDPPPQHSKKNPLVRASESITKKRKYNPGEVIIEWKTKSEIDAKENYCEAGFIYIHFWIKQI